MLLAEVAYADIGLTMPDRKLLRPLQVSDVQRLEMMETIRAQIATTEESVRLDRRAADRRSLIAQ